MFSLGILKIFSNLLKSAPYLLLVGVAIFGVLKLKSCNDDLTQAKKSVVIAKQATQDEKDAVTKQANVENVDTINKLGKSDQVSLDTVVKQTDEEKSISKASTDRELKVKKDLSKVLDTYNSSTKDLDAIRAKDAQISTIQINSIWQTYCGMTPDDNQCKAPS